MTWLPPLRPQRYLKYSISLLPSTNKKLTEAFQTRQQSAEVCLFWSPFSKESNAKPSSCFETLLRQLLGNVNLSPTTPLCLPLVFFLPLVASEEFHYICQWLLFHSHHVKTCPKSLGLPIKLCMLQKAGPPCAFVCALFSVWVPCKSSFGMALARELNWNPSIL